MIIYKISNNKNNKLYIGQTSGTAEKRFNRHINDAINNILDTHFARAIRKYGPENFNIEVIDTAKTQDELDYKEHYWIHYYDTLKKGYNEVDPLIRSGGNTYRAKTLKELEEIKEKIRLTKIGGLNPQSKKVKCKNINTDEEYHFDSLSEMQNFFGETNHNFITRRCRGTVKSLYRKEWAIAYENEEYNKEATVEIKHGRAIKIEVIDLNTKVKKEFNSFAAAERFYGLRERALSSCNKARKKEKHFLFKKQFEITILD